MGLTWGGAVNPARVCGPFPDTAIYLAWLLGAKSLQLCLTLCDTMDCKPTGLLCPWDAPSKNPGLGCYALLQGVFLTQTLNSRFLHLLQWQAGSLPLAPSDYLVSDFKNILQVIWMCAKGWGALLTQVAWPGNIQGSWESQCRVVSGQGWVGSSKRTSFWREENYTSIFETPEVSLALSSSIKQSLIVFGTPRFLQDSWHTLQSRSETVLFFFLKNFLSVLSFMPFLTLAPLKQHHLWVLLCKIGMWAERNSQIFYIIQCWHTFEDVWF